MGFILVHMGKPLPAMPGGRPVFGDVLYDIGFTMVYPIV